MRFRVLLLAEDELVEAAEWYEDRQQHLGEEFIEEYEDAITRILATPQKFSRLETTRSHRHLRRCFLRRFPYYVAYELKDDEIVVLAVAHSRRRPSYFLRRK